MAVKRITMQDVADACGLSRNTVSKIFNDRGSVPEATKRLVLQKARELGYLQVPYYPPDEEAQQPEESAAQPAFRPQNIAMLTCRMPTDYHFAILFLPVFTERMSRNGYTLMVYQVTPEDLQEKRLPSHMLLQQTAGILAIELFDRDYIAMLGSLGVPVLSVDGAADAAYTPMECDFILMESLSSITSLTSQVIAAGARRLGFVGDAHHCCSFHERWTGFCSTLERAGLPVDRSCCILEDDSEPYEDIGWLVAQIQKMPFLPDAFICANDYHAVHILSALKRLGKQVPADVMVTGFDDAPQSDVVEPALSTVRIPNGDLGRIAANVMLERIEQPELPCRRIYLKTTPVWRASTRT